MTTDNNDHGTVPGSSPATLQLPGGLDWHELGKRARADDPLRAYRVLVADLVGLLPGPDGQPDASEFATHLEMRGATFHDCRSGTGNELLDAVSKTLKAGLHFFYQPDLSRADELLAVAGEGQFDALIAAATFIPADVVFAEGAVRIGAGTGNMGGRSWGGGEGRGGVAPLMNTPSFNSRATAQMVFKALLRVRPDLDVVDLYSRVQAGTFDTGDHLRDFPTHKLEGLRIGVLGFGNIGREVAKLAQAFGMRVAVYARGTQQRWVESEGFEFCATVLDAAYGADVLTPHLGLGQGTPEGFANAKVIDARVLSVLAPGAILVNYDRGELVDVAALDDALGSGHVAFAAIDADVFLSCPGKPPTGPLAPYLPLLERHASRMELLPHAAADTDHPSRCAGARQAADQLVAAIRYRCVSNLRGDLPDGYTDLGACTLPGVGAVGANAISAAVNNATALSELRERTRALSDWLAALDGSPASDAGYGETARLGIEAANRLTTQLAGLGLLGSGRGL